MINHISDQPRKIPLEISARHVHLTDADWRELFGLTQPSIARTISQPPQFLAAERVKISGPAGDIDQVAIVGPLRSYTQAELSMTDARRLGIKPPLADSGQLDQAATITIHGTVGRISRPAAIIQRRHIHASPNHAAAAGLHDRQVVQVRIVGARGGVFDQVLVRIDPAFTWQMHIDTDEANSFGLDPAAVGEIIKS